MALSDAQIEELQALMSDAADYQSVFLGIIYGDMGVGKTTLAMEIAQKITPPEKRCLFLDTHRGFDVISENRPDLKHRTDRMACPSVNLLERFLGAIRERQKPFDNYGTIVLDEGTSLADRDLYAVTRSRASADKDADTPTWPDMNTAQNRFLFRVTEPLVQTGLNVIMVCHSRDETVRGKFVGFKPELAGAIGKPFHLVAYMSASNKNNSATGGVDYTRFLQVHPTTKVQTKCRISGLPYQVTPSQLVEAIAEFVKGQRSNVEPLLPVVQYDDDDPAIIGE